MINQDNGILAKSLLHVHGPGKVHGRKNLANILSS